MHHLRAGGISSQDERAKGDQNLGNQMKECWKQVLLQGSLGAALNDSEGSQAEGYAEETPSVMLVTVPFSSLDWLDQTLHSVLSGSLRTGGAGRA